MACHSEIDCLKEPIGKQDQYIAAYGGLQHIQFNPDGSVFVDPVVCTRTTRNELFGNLMLFYTGISRRAADILSVQRKQIGGNRRVLAQMRDISYKMRDVLIRGTGLSQFGALLHESWLLKRQLTEAISNSIIDEYYDRAFKAGALGGKILGAGGGGFLLLFVEPENQAFVRTALNDLRELPFNLEPQGSKIIYVT
jgi:D-glycero-alpha-D-manno-heptose-7-phosphate kinase